MLKTNIQAVHCGYIWGRQDAAGVDEWPCRRNEPTTYELEVSVL